MSDDRDRPAALLTDSQRAYLRGEKDYRPSVERDVKRRIRNRIQAATEDLALLLDRSDWEEVEKALDETDITNGLAFLLANLVPPPDVPGEVGEQKPGQYATDGDRIQFLSHVLEGALGDACDARGHTRDYDISIEIEPKERDPRSAVEFVQQLRDGEITMDRVEELYDEGRISRDTFATVVVKFDE